MSPPHGRTAVLEAVDPRAPLLQCSAVAKSTGRRCGRKAIPGGTVCRAHGGRAPQVVQAAGRRLALGEMVAELDKLGRVVDVDPAEAMLDMVREAAANVVVYRRLVQQLGARVDAGSGALEGDLVDGDEDSELTIDDIDRSELGTAIAGRVDPANWKAAPHVFVVMYNDERERLVRFSKMCRDAGVEEHRVELAERLSGQMAEVLSAGVAGILGAVRRLLDQGELTAGALGELERSEAPRLIRKVVEARVLGTSS